MFLDLVVGQREAEGSATTIRGGQRHTQYKRGGTMARGSRLAAFLPAYPRWTRPKGMADRAPDHSREPFGGRTPKRSTPRKFWINRLPPVGPVVPVVDHDQCHPLIDLRLAIEADVLLVGLLLLSGCGSREEVIQTACKPIPSRRMSEVVSTFPSPSRSEPTGIAPP